MGGSVYLAGMDLFVFLLLGPCCTATGLHLAVAQASSSTPATGIDVVINNNNTAKAHG